MQKLNVLVLVAIVANIAIVSNITACGPMDQSSVQANGVLVDRTSQALSVGALLFASGTYDGCVDRSGAWSLALDGFAGELPNDALSVVKDDVDCVLTLSSLTSGVEATPLEWVDNEADPAIDMDDVFQVSASSFDSGAFYANARLNAVSFASDFTVAVLFSDDPDGAQTGSDTAGFIVSSATATSSQVAAPNYTIAMTGIVVQTDANDVVEGATGTAQLTTGGSNGERFVVRTTSPGTTYADIDDAFLGGSSALLSSLTTLQLTAAGFDIVGADLTSGAIRYVLIVHTVDGVRSYQVITVTFNHA